MYVCLCVCVCVCVCVLQNVIEAREYSDGGVRVCVYVCGHLCMHVCTCASLCAWALQNFIAAERIQRCVHMDVYRRVCVVMCVLKKHHRNSQHLSIFF